jgi:hypothetical protein
MAHEPDTRHEARRRYVHDRQALPTVAIALDVPEGTLRRWKRDAGLAGDDWDMARSASLIAGDGLEHLVGSVVQDYVIVHQATIEELKAAGDIAPLEKAKILASLADSFNKTVGAAGRVSPKISELGVAMDVLKRLGEFVAREHPSAVPALLEVLEPFGRTLGEVYG